MSSTPSHSGKLLNELRRDLVKVLENFNSASKHISLVITHPLLLAEALHESMDLLQVVAREHREEMMVNLVLQATAKPVDEGGRGDITGGDVLILLITD